MRFGNLLITSAALALLGVACKARTYGADQKSFDFSPITRDDDALESFSNVPPSVEAIWSAMRGEAATKLQPGCEPARYSPPAKVKYRGVAILLHGYSACPQQYEQLGPQLARAGYEVFVPLFPGHGEIPISISPRVDKVDFVPKVAAGWGPTVDRVNEIASAFQGEKVLVGLSQGSNIALRATQLQPQLYDRVLLFSPKLRNETAFMSSLFANPVHLLNIDAYVLGMRNGWKSCELVDSLPPVNRAGFCNFENRNAIAMLDFGKIVIDHAIQQGQQGIKTRTPIQMVLSHNDDGTCNNAAAEVMRGMLKAGSSVKACVMAKEVPHAMLSVRDQPYVKPWLVPLFASTERFLTQGTFVPGSSETVTQCALSW
jgi:pimeloyl-ACP methyl ester carboxylesterase